MTEKELNAVKEVIHRYNALSPADNVGRLDILKGLLGHIADDEIIINQPFYCDYGKQISVGKRFFANFHFTVLDEAKVTIGDDCFIGPNVSIYTACHSPCRIDATMGAETDLVSSSDIHGRNHEVSLSERYKYLRTLGELCNARRLCHILLLPRRPYL